MKGLPAGRMGSWKGGGGEGELGGLVFGGELVRGPAG